MKRIYIFLYHSIYWIYRVVNILTFNHFLYKENWYKGAYAVQLVLMPFFYFNYGLLIPSLIEKKYKKFFVLSFLWIAIFVLAYSSWTVYQRSILYGEALRLPDYIETLNNLIYIWLISTGFCLFENWIKNLKKNQQLALDRKNHLLKSEENRMLNHLLSGYLSSLGKKIPEELPDKIILVSDFFKYILYNREKAVSLQTEVSYIKIFEELKNSNGNRVKIKYGAIDDNLLIQSSQIITSINRLVAIAYNKVVLEVMIECGKHNEVLISIPLPEDSLLVEIIAEEFPNSRIEKESTNYRLIVSVESHVANLTVSQLN